MQQKQGARTEFAQALKALSTERGLDPDVIIETTKRAIEAAFRRDARDRGENYDEHEVVVEMNSSTGETQVFAFPLEKPEEKKDVTPPGFGRIAAQTAKQVIHQKIREAEKESIMDEFSGRVGGLISGMILRFDGMGTRVDIGKTEAIMPANEKIQTERLSLNQRLTFLLKAIEETPHGKQILLSRADPQLVVKLFAREVPEIGSGSVEIKAIAREAGVRTKIAVTSSQSGVDPVGSCVGQKGVRVQAVTNELGGERVDIIPFSESDEDMIKGALAPVEVTKISLNQEAKAAQVEVPADQLSLAIGKEGHNAKLASRLTGWTIDIVGTEVPTVEAKKEEVPSEEKTEVKEEPASES